MSQRSRHKPWFTADNFPQRLAGMAWDPEYGAQFGGWPPVIYDVLEALELHKGERMQDPVITSLGDLVRRLKANLAQQKHMDPSREIHHCFVTIYQSEIEMLVEVTERIAGLDAQFAAAQAVQMKVLEVAAPLRSMKACFASRCEGTSCCNTDARWIGREIRRIIKPESERHPTDS